MRSCAPIRIQLSSHPFFELLKTHVFKAYGAFCEAQPPLNAKLFIVFPSIFKLILSFCLKSKISCSNLEIRVVSGKNLELFRSILKGMVTEILF